MACRSVAQTPAPPILHHHVVGMHGLGTRLLDELERPVVLAHDRGFHGSPFYSSLTSSRRYSRCFRIARSAPAERPCLIARWISPCWRRIASPSIDVPDRVDQRGLQHVERPARERTQELVARGRRDDADGTAYRRRGTRPRRDGSPRPRRSPRAARPAVLSVAFLAANPASGTSSERRAARSSSRETLSVSSMVAIDSLTFRRMPSFCVLSTKMPPPGPREARIRCEPASRRKPSRSVGLLTPNSAASSCSVPIRSPGLSPRVERYRRISKATCSLASLRSGPKRAPGESVTARRSRPVRP